MHNIEDTLTGKQKNEIIAYLSTAGWEAELVAAYVVLAQRGPMTILQLSRALKTERTRLYRSIESWVREGIIEEQLAHKTKLYRAAEPQRVKLLIDQKKASLDTLVASFDRFAQATSHLHTSFTDTKVVYHKGREGMRQMLWNSLRAQEELVSYVYRSYKEAVGQSFFNSWVGEFRSRDIRNRELRHPDFLQTVEASKLLYKDLGEGYEWRNVAADTVTITHGMDIYNDVVAVHYWNADDMYGIEMYNPHMAQMQKSMFDHFWGISLSNRKR